MGFREDLLRRIERKRAEISDLEAQVNNAKTYLLGLEEAYKVVSRGAANQDSATPSFRVGSLLARSYEAIKKAGRPLHVNDLLVAVGREVTRADRSALSGTLAAYVRKGEVFTRPAPNTYGLVGMADETSMEPIPPAGFGKL
jgi:hypothetical protein